MRVFLFKPRYSYDPEQFAGNQVPILVIGTKADSAESLRERNALRPSSIADECSADEFSLVSSLFSPFIVYVKYLHAN